MIFIEKANKPQSFHELYQQANPLPGVSTKVPLLQVSKDNDDVSNNDNSNGRTVFVLCESSVITEYIAERQTTTTTNNDVTSTTSSLSLLPTKAKDRAKLRLFIELCSSSFSYLALTRAQNLQQVETEFVQLQEQMMAVDAFLSHVDQQDSGPFLLGRQDFTIAECYLAPFVQRCCGILPNPYHPLSICRDLKLNRLKIWIQAILNRPSVQVTSPPPEEINKAQTKFSKRLNRLKQKAAKEQQ